jgi:hypothetical protein
MIAFKAFPLSLTWGGHYNSPMFSRVLNLLLILSLLGAGLPSILMAQDMGPVIIPEEDLNVKGGFAKPYEYERQAYGYDPDGIEYKENQAEDFQVVFISSTPFTALGSFGLTGLVSLFTRRSFDVGGDYFWPFLGGIAIGSTTIACVSVLSNPYPPPASTTYVEGKPVLPPEICQVPLITAKF